MADLKAQIALSADASGVETGVRAAKLSLADLGATAKKAGAEAADGLSKMGDGGGAAATKIDRDTKNIIGSIQRATAAVQAGSRSGSAFFATLAQQRGVDPEMLKPYLAALDEANAKQKALALAATAAAPAVAVLGKSAAQTGQQHQIAAVQVKDFFEQVVSGGSPLRAFAQQGAAVVSTYGGLGATFTALGSLLSPFVVTVGLVATALAAVGFAAYQGSEQTKAFNKSLQLTGNYAGQTADSFNANAQAIAAFSKATVGQSKEVLQALISTGKFGSDALASIGAAAATVQNLTGQSTDEVVKDFTKLSDGVSAFAINANKQYNFLSAAQFKYIQSLESQGKTEQASKVAVDLLNQSLKERQPQLGTIESLLKAGKQKWSEYWDAALNIGREDTLGQQLDRVAKEIADRAARGALNPMTQGAFERGNARLSDQQSVLQSDQILARRAATLQAAEAKDNQKEIFEASAQYQGALNSLQAAGLQTRLAQQQQASELEQSYLLRSYEEGKVTLSGYSEAKLYILTKEIKDREALINAQIALEKKAVITGSPEEIESGRVAQQQKLIELQRQSIPLQTELLKIQEQFRRGELGPTNPLDTQVDRPNDTFRKFERAQSQATEQGIAERKLAATQAASDLLQTTRDLNVSLIKDDRARGEAEIALDVEFQRKRLDTAGLNEEEQKRVADTLYDYKIAREQSLTEQLKPAYQKQLESWRDTTKLMKDAADDLGDGLLSKSEDAFASFAKTGKLNIKSLADFAIEEFARIAFRAAAAQLSASASGGSSSSGGLFGLLGTVAGLFSGGYSYTGDTSGAAFSATGDAIRGRRAAGGPVDAGATYLVGEQGPELLRMGSQAGSIVPNHALGGGESKLSVINQTTGRIDKATMVQISPTERALIIQEARQQVAADFYDPNSKVSRGVSKNFRTERSR